MILVTVGTTMPFDELLQEMDRLASAGSVEQPLITQGGFSSYTMKNGEQFQARPSIQDLIEASDLVVTHGGATVIQLLIARKPFVAVPNPRGAGDHQTSFLTQVAEIADISWTRDVSALGPMITDRLERGPATTRGALPRAADIIRAMGR